MKTQCLTSETQRHGAEERVSPQSELVLVSRSPDTNRSLGHFPTCQVPRARIATRVLGGDARVTGRWQTKERDRLTARCRCSFDGRGKRNEKLQQADGRNTAQQSRWLWGKDGGFRKLQTYCPTDFIPGCTDPASLP